MRAHSDKVVSLIGKYSLSKYRDELAIATSTIMHVHHINMYKHPYLSYQKNPYQSDATTTNILDAIYRHLTMVMSGYHTDDNEPTHLDNLLTRTWMLVTNYYRLHCMDYSADRNVYLTHATYDLPYRTISSYTDKFNIPLSELYLHYAAEPYIALYKVYSHIDHTDPREISLTDIAGIEANYVYHLQVYQCLVHNIFYNSMHTVDRSIEDMVTHVLPVDILLYHAIYLHYANYRLTHHSNTLVNSIEYSS